MFLIFTIISAILINFSILNNYNSIIFTIIGFFYLFLHSYGYSQILANYSKKYFLNYLIYPLLLSISSGIIYFVFNLNNLTIISLLNFFTVLMLIFYYLKIKKSKNKIKIYFKEFLLELKSFFSSLKLEEILIYVYSLFSLILLYILLKNRINYSIRTFWTILPSSFFLIYFINTFLLFIINSKNKYPIIKLILNVFHINLSFAFAFIIYRLGYGFDPFIHQSTELEIAKNGFINPKPLYYLGYYGFTVIIAKILNVSTIIIDKISIFLVLNFAFLGIFYRFCKEYFKEKKLILFLSFLIFPFSLLIVSTPQAIANLLALTTIFYLVLGNKNNYLALFFVITAGIIHPLTGAPLFIFWFYITFKKYKLLKYLSLLGLIAALPILFFIFNFISPDFVSFQWSWTPLLSFLETFKVNIPQEYNIWKDLIYIWIYNLSLITAILFGFIAIFRKKLLGNKLIAIIPVIFALFLSFLISNQLKFNDLIAYEQGNYSSRILILCSYFIYPLFLVLIYKILSLKNTNITKKSLYLLLSVLVLISVYKSYPRDDQYHLDRGYNLSQADISAVHYIQEKDDSEFLVLAPQMTSVAALKEFGFYNQIENISEEKVFYYPIPTSGDLYSNYLEIVNDDQSRSIIDNVFGNYQVEKIYVVIPHYWHNATNIILNLQESADDWIALDDNQIYVFGFKK